MEIRIKKTPGQPNILSKISYVLVGVLLASFTLSIAIKLLGSWGIGIGFTLLLLLSYFGFSKTKTSIRFRLIIWGVLGTCVFSIIAATAFYFAISSTVE